MSNCPTCGQHVTPEPVAAAPAPSPRPIVVADRPTQRPSQDVIDRGLAAIRDALRAGHVDAPPPKPQAGVATDVENRAKALAFIASRAPDVLPLVLGSARR
jgi:hypothetical protein